jgi:seryl-tRNA synthetase
MALLGLYVVSRTVRQEDDGESEYVDVIIPIGKLTRFIELYEEKNAVLIDLEKAEADMLKKRIQKKAYNKMEKNFSGKIKELDTDLVPFKKELVEASKDFRFIIQKLDYLEAEKISVNDSIRLLSDRYKKGKLPSKAAYQRLSEDLMKRMISAQKKIDKNINDLRAFLV